MTDAMERRRAWDAYVSGYLIGAGSTSHNKPLTVGDVVAIADALLLVRDKRFAMEPKDDDHNHDYLRGHAAGYEQGIEDVKVEVRAERLRIAAMVREWARTCTGRVNISDAFVDFASHLESEQP